MAQKKAQEYFKANPQVNEVFATADDFLFLVEQHANAHTKTLDNKKVVKYTSKGEVNVVVDLEGLELIAKNYNQMKAIAKVIGLTVKGNKAEDYIKALEAYKETKSE